MRFKGLDLNLLKALDVLLEEQHVSRAAERMHVTQPAMSGALNRLREYFKDPLLTQHGKRMLPTPHAVSLAPRLKQTLNDIDGLLSQVAGFDPATSERRFRVITSDYVVTILFPKLAQLFAACAPNIEIVFQNPSERSSAQFDRGEVDLLITPEYMMKPEYEAEHLYDEEQVAVGWAQNPALASGSITEDDFFSSGHVIVELGRIRPNSYVEVFFSQLERKRRIAFNVPSFIAAPELVVGTPLITVTHKSLAKLFASRLDIAFAPLPFDLEPMKQMMACHKSRGDDPSLLWLKARIADVVRDL